MDAMSIANLIVFGLCSFVCGWNVGTKRYNWAIADGILALLNFAVAWL